MKQNSITLFKKIEGLKLKIRSGNNALDNKPFRKHPILPQQCANQIYDHQILWVDLTTMHTL